MQETTVGLLLKKKVILLSTCPGYSNKFILQQIYFLQKIEDFCLQRNSAAEWSSNFSTVSTCTEVKPVDQSLESLNSEVIYFLLYAVFRMLKSMSFSQPISRVF